MTEVHFDDALLSSLKGKVAIITGIALLRINTGGANGIGKATVELFHRHGAYVVFGDVNDEEGIEFEKKLGTYFQSTAYLVVAHISELTYNHGHHYHHYFSRL